MPDHMFGRFILLYVRHILETNDVEWWRSIPERGENGNYSGFRGARPSGVWSGQTLTEGPDGRPCLQGKRERRGRDEQGAAKEARKEP